MSEQPKVLTDEDLDELIAASEYEQAEKNALFDVLRFFEPEVSSRVPPATDLLRKLKAQRQELADLEAEMQRFAEQQLIYSCDAKAQALAWAARLKALQEP